MGEIVQIHQAKLLATKLFYIFGGSFFAHTSPDIRDRYNIEETSSKCKIWGKFYTPKGEGSGVS